MERVIRNFLSGYIMVSPADIDTLMLLGQRRNFDKKIILTYEGEEEQFLNFVVKGLVKKYFRHNNEEMVTQIAQEGDLVCASDSFLSGSPSHYYVETIEPTTFLSFSKNAVEELFTIDKKWEQLGRMMLTKLMLDKERWELELVQLSTIERLNLFISRHGNLVSRVPQKILASYLHIQPETFSRLKHSFNVNMMNSDA